jgi:hypothetical protein
VRWCLLCEIEAEPATDTLCTMQERIVLSPADSAAIKTLPEALRRRIVANETRWRCRCDKWHHPVCGAPPLHLSPQGRGRRPGVSEGVSEGVG